MKLLLMAMSLLGSFFHPQPTNCKKFRNGEFKLSWYGHLDIIKRKGETQQEFLDGSTRPITFKVKWLDDCTYTLTPQADVFKAQPMLPRNAMMTIRIVKTSAKGYTQTASANFMEKEITGEVIKVK